MPQQGMTDLSRIRKRPLEADAATSARAAGEIDIAGGATIAYTSEDPAHPVEHMLDGSCGPGATRWISARPDTTEHIVIEFDRPIRDRREDTPVIKRFGFASSALFLALSGVGGPASAAEGGPRGPMSSQNQTTSIVTRGRMRRVLCGAVILTISLGIYVDTASRGLGQTGKSTPDMAVHPGSPELRTSCWR